jgi:hypothetical protein
VKRARAYRRPVGASASWHSTAGWVAGTGAFARAIRGIGSTAGSRREARRQGGGGGTDGTCALHRPSPPGARRRTAGRRRGAAPGKAHGGPRGDARRPAERGALRIVGRSGDPVSARIEAAMSAADARVREGREEVFAERRRRREAEVRVPTTGRRDQLRRNATEALELARMSDAHVDHGDHGVAARHVPRPAPLDRRA